MPGGGRHGCKPYVKISTTYQSIIKIIDGSESLYKTNGKENATIIFQEVTNMLLDITAPIIPFKGFGEIKLYSTRDELSDLLSLNNVEAMVINENWIRYDIQNSVELFFHLGNNKLFRIITLDNYKGRLFEKIGVGTTEQKMLEIEPSFVYNEFEEVWESDKGVFIEMDAETNRVRWISVYIPELDLENFEEIVQIAVDAGVKKIIPHVYSSIIDQETGDTRTEDVKTLLTMMKNTLNK